MKFSIKLFESWNIKQPAYSLLEVQIALIVLTFGVLGVFSMIKVYSHQMEAAEAWCRENIEYHVISQKSVWMQKIGMPAELTFDPNDLAWEPPVTGEKAYSIELDSFTLDIDTQTASADIKLKKIN